MFCQEAPRSWGPAELQRPQVLQDEPKTPCCAALPGLQGLPGASELLSRASELLSKAMNCCPRPPKCCLGPPNCCPEHVLHCFMGSRTSFSIGRANQKRISC